MNNENEQIDLFGNADLNIKKEIEDLRKQVEYHNMRYHQLDDPEISDYEYDKLTQKLRNLESLHPEYVVTTSPTQKVGSGIKNIFSEVKHNVVMQSLQDVFSFEEVEDFVNKLNLEYGQNLEYVVETKVDGLSVSLEYENGILKVGSTRGDGVIGEDVTQNLKVIASIPHELKTSDTIEVRGEVYLPRKEFERINSELEKEGKAILANPRNAAAGTLRQLNNELVKSRNLSIYVFNVQKSSSKTFNTHSESLVYCKNVGINVIPYSKVCTSVTEVLEEIKRIGTIREDLDFDIDGAVVKINDLNLRQEIGSTSKVPKWAVAYKYPPEKKETKILDIIVNVGRTGQVTPMAVLEPVRVAGSLISRATLHNFDYLKLKDIKINDTCIVQKAGDVIPEIAEIIPSKRTGIEREFDVPTDCPVCGEELEKDENTVALRCTNSECPALIYRSILHFVSRDAMDITGFGEAIVDRFISLGYIKDISDIYYIEYDMIEKLDRFDKKSATNLINSIEKSKQNELGRLIFGLGIRHIGKKSAQVLSENFNDIYDISNATVEDILKLSDFGEIMAVSVVEFFKKPKTIEIIEKLQEAGVNLKSSKKEVKSNILDSMSIVVTGSFDNYSREDIVKLIETNSGKFSNSVSKKTDMVIAGEAAGSKLKKAEDLGVKVISLDEFLKLIENI
ncbi:MAG: NAD-dependent DNA ligase LigA [Clostridia bacterium]|nr:NAD-dependent DNA ligase LigA [Clostridia bacterium]